MKIHITNLYGLGGTAGKAMQDTADIAKHTLQYNELGIYHYPFKSDSPEMLRARLDGIIAAVAHGDIVIIQSPTWNTIGFDEALVTQLNAYSVVKKIFFVHDVPPLMFESNRYLLKRYIDLYNQAEVLIVPSQNMADFLIQEGLTVRKYVVQRMWDCPVSIDFSVTPQYKKLINFAGKIDYLKFSFVQDWKYETVRLAVTAQEGDWEHGANIEFLGWFQDQSTLANTLRKNGGFGLLWTGDEYWMEYMKLNANSKLSLYLAAGLPVIVHSSISEADTILRKGLGFVVDSLDEAVQKVEGMTEEQYNQMVQKVRLFGELIRGGFFTKKVLTDAVFQLLYD